MIAHLLFQILDKFNIASFGFRKILSAVIAIMIFTLIFAIVKFTKIDIPNFTRNIILLALIDLGGFFFLIKNIQKNNSQQNTHSEIHSDTQSQQNTQPQIQSDTQSQQNTQSDIQSEIQSQQNTQSEIQSDIQSEIQSQKES